jgi:hypothetical protein
MKCYNCSKELPTYLEYFGIIKKYCSDKCEKEYKDSMKDKYETQDIKDFFGGIFK